MATEERVQEGTIPFAGFRTWYRVVGNEEAPGRLPVLTLHGGPGVPSECLQPLEGLARTGRRVVFYDQLGCGQSAIESRPDLWTIELFIREVSAVRDALGLARVHILGHSWGGMLAMEYALTQPDGLASLVLSDATPSMARGLAEYKRLYDELPAEVRATLSRHEAAGTTEDPEYQRAAAVYEERHVIATDEVPGYLAHALQQRTEHPEVARVMFGRLMDWDITSRLSEIQVPTLVLVGRHGNVTPALSETIHRGIPHSQMVVFEQSAHFPYISETDRYLETVEQFLDSAE